MQQQQFIKMMVSAEHLWKKVAMRDQNKTQNKTEVLEWDTNSSDSEDELLDEDNSEEDMESWEEDED